MMAATAGGGGPEGGRGRGLGRMLEPNGYGLISRMSTWDDVCLRGIPYVRVFTSLRARILSAEIISLHDLNIKRRHFEQHLDYVLLRGKKRKSF